MNVEPRVSVIVATYNYGRYIGDALRSVQAQTLSDWECIVVDDASTDDTAEVVQAFVARDPRFRYVRLEHNSGVSVARNTGMDQARGVYLQLLDADDVIAPEKLDRQSDWLETHSEADIVHSDHVRFVDEPDLNAPGRLAQDEKVSGRQALRRAIKSNFLRLNAVLFRRSVHVHIGGFRDQFRYAEDWDYWLRAMAAGHQVHFLDDPMAIAAVRNTPGSLSKDLPAMRAFHLPVRQSLWNRAGLTLGDRCRLVVRYVDFWLEMVLVKREPVVVLDEGRTTFYPLAVACAVLVIPLWIPMRLFIRR